MWDDPLKQAAELRAQGEPFVLATVVACRRPTSAYPGAKAIIGRGGAFSGWVGGSCAQPIVVRESLKAMADGSPRLLRISPDPRPDDQAEDGVLEFSMPCQSQGALQIYIEPYFPRPELLIIGETPLAQALAHAGKLMDFAVCISDQAATRELFPDADVILTSLEEVPAGVGPDSYIVVATQGHYDEDALAAVLRGDAAYIGLVASKKRAEAVYQYLRDKGFGPEKVRQVRCPAGLSLGGVTPPEIALSIAAEILQIRRRRSLSVAAEGSQQPAAPARTEGAEADEVLDPVCGMTVQVATAMHSSTHTGRTFYFCARGCQEIFERKPESYLTEPSNEAVSIRERGSPGG